ncbi:putative transcriptional regulatory protein [Aurantimonas manganoxydans SI85-9A1]|uniref:Putative transcriptional regulatory protein n=1 Tax=Aurantimonas manganoxydans (strain ATCC BAA-1229 / DSM 21871 / SI85-9A1) TaxID=287752 RepID=Q1YGD9_AURMS|nr:winged helix-turn-helix domain-containing protein [Aurantimonas manganoxydans]EAS49286.1 putative transcriptional regulatory protein [Aurantimonas manganoxydans SI85-9A1]
MRYVFEPFELEPMKGELRRDGQRVAVEPQVFALLLLLVENSERMVSKEEIVEKIWDGRAVSDAAVSSRIKSARRALGDDGRQQRLIRTLHGRGIRFVGEVAIVVAPPAAMPAADPVDSATRGLPAGRPSIAVLPFRAIGTPRAYGAIGEAVAHDLIASLSRLRWLDVIARGSSFRFRRPKVDVDEIGRLLNVGYCLSGIVEIFGSSITIIVELVDTRSGSILWGDHIDARIDDVHAVRARVVAGVVAALEVRIPLNEASLATLSGPENLDAWAAYHLGLKHLYRFNRQDNAAATSLFALAVEKEPRFARGHAGLSSANFQGAFLRYGDREHDQAEARRCAERSVELDPVDPFANFALGRAFWLVGDIDASLPWLDRSTELSPNYAQGFYARAWADTITERNLDGSDNVDRALTLSPLDPFRYAMLGTRALICLTRGETAEAAVWADRAARAPGAHVLIALIALVARELNGDSREAAAWARDVRSRRSGLSRAHFFAAFPYKDGSLKRGIAHALRQHGF